MQISAGPQFGILLISRNIHQNILRRALNVVFAPEPGDATQDVVLFNTYQDEDCFAFEGLRPQDEALIGRCLERNQIPFVMLPDVHFEHIKGKQKPWLAALSPC
jgi:hypothetical protein